MAKNKAQCRFSNMQPSPCATKHKYDLANLDKILELQTCLIKILSFLQKKGKIEEAFSKNSIAINGINGIAYLTINLFGNLGKSQYPGLTSISRGDKDIDEYLNSKSFLAISDKVRQESREGTFDNQRA